MNTKATTLVVLVVVCLLISSVHLAFGQEVDASMIDTSSYCVDELPDAAYLGEGSGEYTLPPGFSEFVVKRNNGHFYVEPGPTYDSPGPADEWVYACEGICDKFAKLYKSHVRLGELQTGDVVNILVLDHKTKNRPHWWSHNPNPMDPYILIDTASRVEYFTLTVPFTEKWWFHSEDEVGVVLECIAEQNTPIPTETQEPTATQTHEPTKTSTVEPTATQTQEPTKQPTETPVQTSTETVEPTATATGTSEPTLTPQPTQQPSETPTEQPTEEPTLTPVPTSQGTPSPTPTAIPTGPVDPGDKDLVYYYLPIVACQGDSNPLNYCTYTIEGSSMYD